MAGAAILCGKAALRTGAGLVQISVPDEILSIVQTGLPEATCITRESIFKNLKNYHAVAFGPGIGTGERNILMLERIMEDFQKPLVIDADGLTILEKTKGLALLNTGRENIIITPHMGEAKRILGYSEEEYKKFSREEIARELHKRSRAIVVLKGHETIVFNGDEIWINQTGNSGMATGGSGDVLTGMIASLCGQGYKPEMAAKLGVYIHGLAGDLAKVEFGEHGLIAGDLCYYAAKAMKLLGEEGN